MVRVGFFSPFCHLPQEDDGAWDASFGRHCSTSFITEPDILALLEAMTCILLLHSVACSDSGRGFFDTSWGRRELYVSNIVKFHRAKCILVSLPFKGRSCSDTWHRNLQLLSHADRVFRCSLARSC